MTFAFQQLVEKSVEHQTKQFIVFVDLKKANNLVFCEALWRTPEKPNVHAFHKGMKAQVSINGELLEEKFKVENVSINLLH